MKNKSILIAIALCVGLQSNMSFSAQQPQEQSYLQRFRSAVSNWWYKRGGSTSVKTGAMVGAAVPAAVLAIGATSPETLGLQDFSPSMDQDTLLRGAAATVVFAGIGAVSATVFNLMRQVWEHFSRGTISKDNLKQTMENIFRANILSLYPTRSTKIDLLTKHRDNLITQLSKKGILVENNKTIIDEICNELLQEIQATEETQQDRDLDAKISVIRDSLVGESTANKLQDLRTQITKLTHDLRTQITELTHNIAIYRYLTVKLEQESIEEDAFNFVD